VPLPRPERPEQSELNFERLPPDKTQPCSKCGHEIVVAHYRVGYICSEYVGKDGRCWECDKK
jgi:hypothetical protein